MTQVSEHLPMIKKAEQVVIKLRQELQPQIDALLEQTQNPDAAKKAYYLDNLIKSTFQELQDLRAVIDPERGFHEIELPDEHERGISA